MNKENSINPSVIGKHLYKIPVYSVLVVFAVIALYPIYHVLITSLKSSVEYVDNKLFWPDSVTLDNYKYVLFQGSMMKYFLNNCIIMPLAMAGYLFVCITAGFAFGRLRFPYRLQIFLAVLFLMIFPQMLLSVQIFQICRHLHLINNYFGLILVWIAYFSPFGTYIMATYYSTVPYELIESAKMDGATIWQTLWYIMVPIAKPMFGIVFIIGFQSMWNELIFSLLLLQKNAMRTITQGIGMLQGQYGLDDTRLTAAIMIASLVPLILFLFFQKFIAMGSYSGATKG
ncbi:MAG: carbohydrate ABC transporter permease [Spirochaetes bacterium]|nr:carbohydrate ABC transporter permease [Spirochaetota bacterium]